MKLSWFDIRTVSISRQFVTIDPVRTAICEISKLKGSDAPLLPKGILHGPDSVILGPPTVFWAVWVQIVGDGAPYPHARCTRQPYIITSCNPFSLSTERDQKFREEFHYDLIALDLGFLFLMGG